MNLSVIEHSNNTKQRRLAYVPASVKIIETSVQRVICTSDGALDKYPGNSWD